MAGIESLHWCMDSLRVSRTVNNSLQTSKQPAGIGVPSGKCTVTKFSLLLTTRLRTRQTEADGLTTQASGVLLGIATADCVPVLLVAPQQRVIAALHAGWRGTLKGITARALALLSSSWGVVPSDVWLACGPAIGPCCYEVGRDVGEALYERWGASNPATWQPKGEKGLLDLRLINLLQSEQLGVPRDHMQMVGSCTFCDASRFASYRRQGPQAGRQLSVIGWQKTTENQ